MDKSALVTKEGVSTASVLMQVVTTISEGGVTTDEMLGRLSVKAALEAVPADAEYMDLEPNAAAFIFGQMTNTKWHIIDPGITTIYTNLMALSKLPRS
jgi:hypothetical protein